MVVHKETAFLQRAISVWDLALAFTRLAGAAIKLGSAHVLRNERSISEWPYFSLHPQLEVEQSQLEQFTLLTRAKGICW